MSGSASKFQGVINTQGDDTRGAQILALNNLIPISNYQVVDSLKHLNIWKGKIVKHAVQSKMFGDADEVYFIRKYDLNNDLDKCLQEFEILDETIVGYPFLLVPKEKCIFFYAPPSLIARIPGTLFGGSSQMPKRRQ